MMAARDLCTEFRNYVTQNHERHGSGPSSLEELIFQWLEHGNAAEEAGGDFGTYMQGVLCIIVTWLADQSFLDFKGSATEPPHKIEVYGLIEDLDLFEHNLAFDRDNFNSVIFRRLLRPPTN